MEELYSNIRKLRTAKGISQDELAKLAGYKDRSSIAKIEAGKVDLTQSKVMMFSKVLGVTPSQLMGIMDNDEKEHEPILKKSIPLLGSVVNDNLVFEQTDWEGFDATQNNSMTVDFCIRASEDSMNTAGICKDDVVFVHKQATIENSLIAAVSVNSEIFIRRIYYDPDIYTLILTADNPKYAPMAFTGDMLSCVTLLGVVVSVRHSFL